MIRGEGTADSVSESSRKQNSIRKLAFGAGLFTMMTYTISFLLATYVVFGYRYPDNHGAGYTELLFVCIFTALVSVAVVKWHRKMAALLAILALSGFVILWVLDSRNILISYETWIERSMPKWGENLQKEH